MLGMYLFVGTLTLIVMCAIWYTVAPRRFTDKNRNALDIVGRAGVLAPISLLVMLVVLFFTWPIWTILGVRRVIVDGYDTRMEAKLRQAQIQDVKRTLLHVEKFIKEFGSDMSPDIAQQYQELRDSLSKKLHRP